MDLLFETWKEEGREVLYRPVPTEAKAFTPRLNPSVRITMNDLTTDGGSKLLDTRTPESILAKRRWTIAPGTYLARSTSPTRIWSAVAEGCSSSRSCYNGGWRRPESRPATRWWHIAAAGSGLHWLTYPCGRPGTMSDSTTAPTQSGWTAATQWKSDFFTASRKSGCGACWTRSRTAVPARPA